MVDFIKSNSSSYINDIDFFPFPYGYNNSSSNENFNKNGLIKINKVKKYITGVFAGDVHGDISIFEILEGLSIFFKENNKNIKIYCYGTLFGFSGDIDKLLKNYNLDGKIIYKDYVPYEKFVKILESSDFLILPHGESPVTKVLYPTKFFDYLRVKKPILYWGVKSNVWETINKINAGICSFPKSKEILISLNKIINSHSFYENDIEYKKFSRDEIFNDFCNRLNKLSKNFKNNNCLIEFLVH